MIDWLSWKFHWASSSLICHFQFTMSSSWLKANERRNITFTWNALIHTHMEPCSFQRCVCSDFCDVMSCRGKLKFQLNFCKWFFSSFFCEKLTSSSFVFSFCHFQRLATMATINQWSRNSASRLRRKKSWDHSSVYSSRTGRWMLWAASSIGCVYKRRKMSTRTPVVAWLRQLRIRKVNGELSSNHGKSRICVKVINISNSHKRASCSLSFSPTCGEQ